MADNSTPPDLTGRIAVVVGATRGVGRGIAEVLGQCGASVYVTGRSTRTKKTFEGGSTIQDVAETVTASGGRGIASSPDSRGRRGSSPPGRSAAATSRGGPRRTFFAKTETVHYSGRAVAALAADPEVLARSGSVMRVFEWACAYGFTDTDGRVALSLSDS